MELIQMNSAFGRLETSMSPRGNNQIYHKQYKDKISSTSAQISTKVVVVLSVYSQAMNTDYNQPL